MRSAPIRPLFVLLALLCLLPVAAQAAAGRTEAPVPRLFELSGPPVAVKAGGMEATPEAVEETVIDIDPELVASDPARLVLELPNGMVLEARRERFVSYRPDWKSWFGRIGWLGAAELPGYIHLGYHGEQVTAVVNFQDQRYRIVGGFAGPHRLAKLGSSGYLSCGVDHEPPTAHLPNDLARAIASLPIPETEEPLGFLEKISTRIDVMAIYPKAYFSFPTSEATLFNFIEDSISLANDIFANSGVSAYYNLVHIGPIIGTQPPATGLIDALTWLDGNPTEVTDLRTAFGADVVAIYIPWIWDDDDYCGIANLPEQTTYRTSTGRKFTSMGDRAYSANRDSCGLNDFTLGHEIGHNFGMRHDDDPTSDTYNLYSYGEGYLFTVSGSQMATVMACTCKSRLVCPDISDAVCDRIAYFSDDTQTYLGVAIGDSGHRNEDVATARKSTVAGYKAQSLNTPPTGDFTVSCNSGTNTCTFDASSSTDNAAIPSTGYWWDFGDGTTGTGKIVTHTYTYGSFAWVHLVVTDSGGQRDVDLASASY